jgi:SNF2 family DNA or RNA helicase
MSKGGILADDMGLGKTMQCSAFLAGEIHALLDILQGSRLEIHPQQR